jgi:hypothetical protein
VAESHRRGEKKMTDDEVMERADKAAFLNWLILESFNPIGSSFGDRQRILNDWAREYQKRKLSTKDAR